MRSAFVLMLALLLTGCAAQRVYEDGLALFDAGKVEEGLARIEEAARMEPQSRQYRQAYLRQRDIALQRDLALGEAARRQGQWEAAEAAYRRMLILDRDNSRAKAGLEALRIERAQRQRLAQAEDLLKKGDAAAALALARSITAENSGFREAQHLVRRIEEQSLRAATAAPRLAAALRKPVTLEFRDASLRQVFELLSRSAGLNFIFDREVRPDLRTTVFVRNSSVEEVLRFILVTNQLQSKVLSENTVLVYPATPAKLRDYQELVVKTFYLGNADAKTAANLIRTLVKTKDLHVDEKLNLVVMRDTPDAVRMAERLVANQDLAEAEVMLEVEVLEVATNVLHELGLRYPDQVSWSLVGAAGTAGAVTLPEWLNRGSELVRLSFTNPLFALNFRNTLGRTNLLANPRIRVKNKDKAKVHIGDKVPVITTTTTATGFVSEAVNYLDVGLKLDVEPTVFLDDEVGIKVALEVSSIVREIRSPTGTLTYQIGTRNASTTLRLKDGETQVLAGLISDEDRKSANQVPGLGDIPVIGRLFGSHQDTANKTEIVLLMTPRVVRNLARPELRLEEFPGGTESAIGAPPLLLQSLTATPVSQGSPGPAPSTQAGSRVTLQVLPAPASSQEFSVAVGVETAASLRGGLFDIAFDNARLRFVRAEPGAWLAGDPGAAIRVSAPEGLGRLSVNLTGKSDSKGPGELVRIVFQRQGDVVGSPSLRIEAATLTTVEGQVLGAQLPPPLTFNLAK